MSLSEPSDLLADFPGWVTEFDPVFRQETSRVAGGRTYMKNLGPSLWGMAARSKVLRPNVLDEWRARLQALENGLVTFLGYSMSRGYPILYPRGTWPTGLAFDGEASLYDVGVNRKSIRISQLPAGFTLSVGDMVQIGNADLHRVQEQTIADGSGITPAFEVRPHIWPGIEGGVSPALSVYLRKPHCVMAIEPGSVSTGADLSGRGTVSFRAIEAR